MSDPEPLDKGQDPLARLDTDLNRFEARHRKSASGPGLISGSGASDGYRVVSQMLGGVLIGVGLGWLADRYGHVSPWGLVVGILGGAGLSVYATIRAALHMGEKNRPTGLDKKD